MTNSNTELRTIKKRINYGPMDYGPKAGQPTVHLKLSSSDENATEIGSMEAIFSQYGWKQKLRSGFAHLHIFGTDPLDEMHRDGLEHFDNVMSPQFTNMEIEGDDIKTVPSRPVQSMVDTYSLVISPDEEYGDDAMEWFADRSSSFGDVSFIVEVDSVSQEGFINRFSREYAVYDSDIWLYPKGRKVNTVKENRDKAVQIAKRNTWNVSPRSDVIDSFEKDE